MKPYEKIIDIGERCFGCGVCAAVCPVEIIRFETDGAGFYRPTVADGKQCTECGFCADSCAALAGGCGTAESVGYFAGFSDNRETRRQTSSGGVGYELARSWTARGGAFCGARYDAAARAAEHFFTTAPEETAEARGSKYMQSDSPSALRRALSDKGEVMFTGTPCQVASLRRYLRLRGREEQFLLVDFFCFGVPSMNLWRKYVGDHAATLGEADSVTFRDKTDGWHASYRIRGTRAGATVYLSKERDDLFYKFFLRRYVQQKACYECPFRDENSAADVRLGDFWGEKYADNGEGVSVVVAVTEKGRTALLQTDGVTLHAETAETVMEGRPSGAQPVPAARGRLLSELTGPRTLAQIYRRYRLRLYAWRLGYRVKRKMCRWRRSKSK
ncbi:MAG: Coenzyme F420 hydrogenase/dehydrogenase, beta subunit C-terminal domain [Rikenellaceae bacterium]|nr:Coenzyme F420 hydrogenase/dehydrogenase, beta subunit C-terminal domain [Rikenellaceae bacterium]MCL2692771.1 Coenzyme F420 hydrogenase/dehydrogenase, beta subunit C-terminal domain [Rikenellaceae bacterium]